jgi:signal transduction histidine kinase
MTNNHNTILIVDDNPTNLRMLMNCLEEIGLDVLVAEDGQVALELLDHTKPDLILLDIMMPGINGLDTCRTIKQSPEFSDIPIIFMTALSDTESKLEGFKAGAVDYITKPLQYVEVVARVETHLSMRKMQLKLQQTNRQLTQANQTLSAMNEELDAFARTVAHDLNNPVGVILGTSEMLEMKLVSPDKIQKSLHNITRTAYKMRNIISALLLLSRVRQTEVQLQLVDMMAVVLAAQERLAEEIKSYQAEIHLPAYLPQAIGYSSWLEEVWVNYLSNGLKYGGTPPHLHLGATPLADNMIKFWVQDNGPGLTEEQQTKKLFTPFTRLTTLNIEGYGIGLSIVDRVIHKLNGQVGVESVPGHGSRFSFTLPAATSPTLPSPTTPTQRPLPSSGCGPEPPAPADAAPV